MNDLHELSLTEVCQHMKSGALTAEAVTGHMLDRITTLEPRYKAFATVRSEEALARARQLDLQRRDGKPLGTLHGVPVAAKDLLFMAGEVVASGTQVMADFRPTTTATVVERLEQAGAVIIGRTQLTEGAFSAHHPNIDPPRNPWDAGHWTGVSSSGSGVAVAARLCYGALGTDTGGSIRFPSASCGVVGLKPTYGRVSRFGAFPLAQSLDHIGPMTRTVADAARLLGVIAGLDPRDRSTADLAVPNYVAAQSKSLQGVKLAVDWHYAESGIDPVVSQAIREAVERCVQLGATVREVVMPPEYHTLVSKWVVTCARECAQVHAQYFPTRRKDYGPVLAGLLDLGLSVGESAYDDIEMVRNRFRSELDILLSDVHALITPNMVAAVPLLDEMNTRAATRQSGVAFTTFTAPFNYSGHPTLTLPTGLAAGLPTSIQLVGPRFQEAHLVKIGSALESSLTPMPYQRMT